MGGGGRGGLRGKEKCCTSTAHDNIFRKNLSRDRGEAVHIFQFSRMRLVVLVLCIATDVRLVRDLDPYSPFLVVQK